MRWTTEQLATFERDGVLFVEGLFNPQEVARFRSAATPDASMAVIPARGGNLYWRGLLIQMTNPKAALHWIAIVGIGPGAGAPLWVGIALVVSTTMLSLFGHLAYAVAFSTAPVVEFYRRARRWIEGALGLFFTVAAFKIATYKP